MYKIITFTGPDGVGKSTICNFVNDWINNTGNKSVVLKFPHFTDTIEAILYYRNLDCSPTLRAEFIQEAFQKDRIRAQHEMAHYVSNSVIILCDRYDVDTWFYGLAAGVSRQMLKSILGTSILRSTHVIRMFGHSWTRDTVQSTDCIGDTFSQSKLHEVYEKADLPYAECKDYKIKLSESDNLEFVKNIALDIVKDILHE